MKIKIILLTLLLLSSALFSWYTFPKHHSRTLQGVSYKLGNMNDVNKVIINIDGKVQKTLLGKRTFKGTIDIEGEELPVPKNQREIVIEFLNNGLGFITYGGVEDGRPFTHGYGSIFANDDFSKVTILRGSWTAYDGSMMTAPASDRAEAISISNTLMRQFLNGTLPLK